MIPESESESEIESEIIFSRICDKNAVFIVGLMAIIRKLPV